MSGSLDRVTSTHCNRCTCVLCRFLQNAISVLADDSVAATGNREDWTARDLRFVRLLGKVVDERTQQEAQLIQPLCAAAYQGMARFLTVVALETQEQDEAALIKCLENAINTGKLPPTAVGFAQEHIFLLKLAGSINRTITATASSAASPLQGAEALDAIDFVFERVRTVPSFNHPTRAVATYNTTGASVLYIPHDPNEKFIDAAVYNYRTKTICALQVTGTARFAGLIRLWFHR